MEIIKFGGRNCVKCKMLDKVFAKVELPCEVKTRYVEDESHEQFIQEGIDCLPTLLFKNDKETIKLTGAITPKQITEAINKLKD